MFKLNEMSFVVLFLFVCLFVCLFFMKRLKILSRLPNSATHPQKTLTDRGTLLCVLKYF